MTEWTDEDETVCQAACEEFMFNDHQIPFLENRLSYIQAHPDQYSLAEADKLRAEIIRAEISVRGGVREKYSYQYGQIKDERSELFAYLRSTPNTPPNWDDRKKADDRARECTRILERLEAGKDPDQTEDQAKDQTLAQQRQVGLIEKVRELMLHELNTTWPEGQRGLKAHIIQQHGITLRCIYGQVADSALARKTQPVECKKLGIPELPM